MTEVCNCGGGHRTRLNNCQLVCLWGAPSPVYKEGEGRPSGPHRRAKGGGILLLVGVGLPPFLVLLGEEGRRGKGKEGGGAAPPPSPIRTRPMGGGGQPLAVPLCLSPLGPIRPITSPVVPITLPALRYLSGDTRNSSGVRITSSNISFFMSRPFRDSSSCP